MLDRSLSEKQVVTPVSFNKPVGVLAAMIVLPPVELLVLPVLSGLGSPRAGGAVACAVTTRCERK